MFDQATGDRWDPRTMTWSKVTPFVPALVTTDEPSAPIAAALPANEPAPKAEFKEAYGTPIDPDEAQWKPLSGNPQRDLPMVTQERMLRIAHWLWEQNPLANWIIEVKVAFLLAEGVHLAVEDEENQKALTRFWKDAINDMAVKLPKKVRELAMFGEQLWPAFVNETDGMVRLGYIDPKVIDIVVTDPDNREQPIGIVTKKDDKGRFYKFRVLISGPESVFTQKTQEIRAKFSDGEAFYFRVNDLSAGTRGRSDLLASADWLDLYDQFLFGEGDRAKLLRALVWDLTLKNADENAVKKRAREFVLPASGGAYVHNDSETLEPKTPELKAADTSDGARMLRNHVLGSHGLPEHWYGGGGDVNRAAATEMDEPTFKMLSMRQSVWKNILESLGRYVLMKKAAADGVAPESIDWSDPKWNVQAIFPELVSADVGKYAQAVQQIVVGCAMALDKGLLQEKTAVQLVAAVATRLGVEIDADEELAKARSELATKKAADVYTDPLTGEPGAGATPAAAAARTPAAAAA